MSQQLDFNRRQFVSRGSACLCMCSIPYIAYAQRKLIFSGEACGLSRDAQLGTIVAFESSSEAKQIVVDICASVGLPANFEIVAVQDPSVNAYATIREGRRYVVYDEQFMRSVADRRVRDWSGLAVMAHEVGHHLCGHTLDRVGSRPPRELEADTFAGFAVGTLGGTLGEASKVFRGMSESGSITHPPRHERVAAVTAGWQRASRKQQSNGEQLNVISHNQRADGGYARVVAAFVKNGSSWVEYQHGSPIATFVEGARDSAAIYLFDSSRMLWLRITTDTGARVSVGAWSLGRTGEVPVRWTPLDPIQWR